MEALPLPSLLNNVPRFSVIIPVYNRVGPLAKSLNSVLSQSQQSFEIIVVDDGSSTDVASQINELVANLNDERIKLLRHSQNRNGAAARNTGIQEASGEYLCFLDSDDSWLPSKLEKVNQSIGNALPNENFLIHHQYRNSQGTVLSAALPIKAKQYSESVAHYSFVTNNVGGIQSSTICVPSKLAKKVKFDETLTGHQDWDFALKVGALTQDFRFIEEVLAIRGRDSNDSVAKGLSWQYSLWFYSQRASYFDNLSALHFFQRVVLRKAVFCLDLIPAISNKLFLRGLLTKPIATIKISISFFAQVSQLKKRVRQVEITCKKRNVKSLMIWGANDYAKSLILNINESFEVLGVIDSKVMKTQMKLQGIEVTSIKSVGKAELGKVGALVLATDRHQNSMKHDIVNIEPTLLQKIIEF